MRFYKTFDLTLLVHFIKTDGKETETDIMCGYNGRPYSINYNPYRFFKVQKNKLTQFSFKTILYATEHFMEITEAEFDAKVNELIGSINQEKTTAQRVRCVAI